MSRRQLLILTLLLLSSISIWLAVEVSHEEPQKISIANLGQDYYMNTVTSVVMDKSGTPIYRFTATKLAHYPGDQHIELTSPNITIFHPSREVWTISAKQGTLLQKKNEIRLTGDVILNSLQKNTQDKDIIPRSVMTISTQTLNIFTDRHLASTDQAVTISTRYGKISAIGMNLRTDNQTMELKSTVRGSYVSSQ